MTGPAPQFLKITKGEGNGIIIGLIPKSGFTSILHSLRPDSADRVSRLEALDEQLPIRLYVREPFARFISAWRYLSSTHGGLYKELGLPEGYSFKQFTDRILDAGQPGDTHWMPQIARFKGYNITEIYQFERILETWPSDLLLKHLKRSPADVPVPKIDYRVGDLLEYYAEDIAAWLDQEEHDDGE